MERKLVKRTRTTYLGRDYDPRWSDLTKLQIPADDIISYIGQRSVEEKCWDDDDDRPIYRTRYVVESIHYSPETDKELQERIVNEEKERRAKLLRDKQEEDAEYITYLKLKAKYAGRENEVSKDSTCPVERRNKRRQDLANRRTSS